MTEICGENTPFVLFGYFSDPKSAAENFDKRFEYCRSDLFLFDFCGYVVYFSALEIFKGTWKPRQAKKLMSEWSENGPKDRWTVCLTKSIELCQGSCGLQH